VGFAVVTSAIDPSKPTEGEALTADVRQNFQIAADEISNLQTTVAALQATVQDNYDAITALQATVETLKARSQIAGTLITVNPPNTNSTSFVTAGIGFQFTPTNDSRAILLLDGQLGNTGNGSGSDLQVVFGIGASPAIGTLITATNGTFVGNLVNMVATKPNDFDPFGISTMLTGLVSGQQYWIDAAYRAEQGTATLSQMSLTMFEVLDPLP
jgi:hypothetical protein